MHRGDPANRIAFLFAAALRAGTDFPEVVEGKNAVHQWKFKPGYKDGKPVTVAATIEVNFRLL